MKKYIVVHGDKWAVRNPKDKTILKILNTQKEAIIYAASQAHTTGLAIQDTNGRFRRLTSWDISQMTHDQRQGLNQGLVSAVHKAEAKKAAAAMRTTTTKTGNEQALHEATKLKDFKAAEAEKSAAETQKAQAEAEQAQVLHEAAKLEVAKETGDETSSITEMKDAERRANDETRRIRLETEQMKLQMAIEKAKLTSANMIVPKAAPKQATPKKAAPKKTVVKRKTAKKTTPTVVTVKPKPVAKKTTPTVVTVKPKPVAKKTLTKQKTHKNVTSNVTVMVNNNKKQPSKVVVAAQPKGPQTATNKGKDIPLVKKHYFRNASIIFVVTAILLISAFYLVAELTTWFDDFYKNFPNWLKISKFK